MKTLSTFVITVALIVGLVGCGPTPSQYDLTMAVAPSGGGTATDLTNASPYAAGASVNIEATASSGYQFVDWTASAGTFANANAAETTFAVPAENVTVTANFVRVYDLTIVVDPVGQGTATDLTKASPYAEGTSVSIRAAANSGYHFVNWEASAGAFGNTTAAQTSFTMPAQSVTVTANFAVDLYFRTDAWLTLDGPATLPPEKRNPWVGLDVFTNIVVDSVRVNLPGGGSVIAPAHTGVFTPDVDQTALFGFGTGVAGMPTAGGEYVFTGLDTAGEPIPGAGSTDVWVGVGPPDPPTNVRAELTGDGILVSWDESPMIRGSFEPAADPQLGYYQLTVYSIETGGEVCGSAFISACSHLIPRDKSKSVDGKDFGLSLGEMEDGAYRVIVSSHSMAPAGSLGRGHEYTCSDPGQSIVFAIQNGQTVMG